MIAGVFLGLSNLISHDQLVIQVVSQEYATVKSLSNQVEMNLLLVRFDSR